MNSNRMKLALLEYYRFKRGFLVGTEVHVSWGIADVLSISSDLSKSYEVEVKVSISDLKADFKFKEEKHKYIEYEDNQRLMRPNYFYFAFPETIIEKAQTFLLTKNLKYGIIQISKDKEVTIVKTAKKLNNTSNTQLKHYLDLRINNQLITVLQSLGDVKVSTYTEVPDFKCT